MAKASIHLMNLDKKIYSKHTSLMCSHVNVGGGIELSIKELSEIIKEIVGFKGKIIFDNDKPDGTLRKFLNCAKLENQFETKIIKRRFKKNLSRIFKV